MHPLLILGSQGMRETIISIFPYDENFKRARGSIIRSLHGFSPFTLSVFTVNDGCYIRRCCCYSTYLRDSSFIRYYLLPFRKDTIVWAFKPEEFGCLQNAEKASMIF